VDGSTATLILESIEFNVASYGGVEISDVGGKVALDKGAKIILVDGENGQPTEWTNITAGTGNVVRLTGAGLVGLTLDPTSTKQPAWSVAHKGGEAGEVNIIAASGTVILGKTPKAEFTR
jgi:hypothetical protein